MLPNGTPQMRRFTRKRIGAAIVVCAVVLAISSALRSDKQFEAAIDPYPAPYAAAPVDDGSESQATTEPGTPSPAINPFARASVAGEHLVRLDMSDASDVIVHTQTDLVAEAIVADPLLSYATSQLGNLVSEAEPAAANTGSVARLAGPSGMSGALNGGGGFPISGGGGSDSNRSLTVDKPSLYGDNADSGPAETPFVYLSDDQSNVSVFPASDGLSILSDDSDPALGIPGAQLLLDEDIELVHAPEPASLLLLGSGLVVIAHRLRKRTRNSPISSTQVR